MTAAKQMHWIFFVDEMEWEDVGPKASHFPLGSAFLEEIRHRGKRQENAKVIAFERKTTAKHNEGKGGRGTGMF